MYDMAKRSLAFTVATGGLLLTGTGYAPADAAVAFGALPGPAQAQGSAAVNQASPSSVSTPISVRAPEAKPVRVLAPAAPRAGMPGGAGAAASSTVKNSGGILSGNTVQIPIDLGLNLCTYQADAIAASNTVHGSTCGGPSAAGGADSGATATTSTSHSGGILSGNTVQVPVNVPLEVCGNQAVAVGLKNAVHGGTCGDSAAPGGSGPGSGAGSPGGSSATAVTDHSGGILSGNIIQAPVNVPVNACGNQANVIAVKDKVGGTVCSTSSGTGAGSHGPGASATAVTINSGGIGSGMTVQTPINVPVNACGNQATVVGAANTAGGATCLGSSGTTSATSATINSGGIASGTSAQVPINVPVNACGNQAGVGSVKDTVGGTQCTSPSTPSSTTTSVVTNSGGILSGNQPAVPINVPVNVCGDQASVIGVDNTTGSVICGKPGPIPTPSSSPSNSPSPRPSHSYMPPPPPPSGTPSVPPPCNECGSPSGSPSPSNSPTRIPPPHHGPHQGPPHVHHGSLARTGGEEGMALAAAGAAVLAGVGLRVASKRRAR
jgi:LPXTG-motif cell wall-anchored protein